MLDRVTCPIEQAMEAAVHLHIIDEIKNDEN